MSYILWGIVIYLFNIIPVDAVTYMGDYQPTSFVDALVRVVIIIGVLLFAQQLPKFIEDLFGFKLGGSFSLNPAKRLKESAGVAAAMGALGATAGRTVANMRNAYNNSQGEHGDNVKATGAAIGKGLFGGLGRSVASGFKGGMASAKGKSINPMDAMRRGGQDEANRVKQKARNAAMGYTWKNRAADYGRSLTGQKGTVEENKATAEKQIKAYERNMRNLRSIQANNTAINEARQQLAGLPRDPNGNIVDAVTATSLTEKISSLNSNNMQYASSLRGKTYEDVNGEKQFYINENAFDTDGSVNENSTEYGQFLNDNGSMQYQTQHQIDALQDTINKIYEPSIKAKESSKNKGGGK